MLSCRHQGALRYRLSLIRRTRATSHSAASMELFELHEILRSRDILSAAPEGGALVLPVVSETEAVVFVVASGTAEAVPIPLPNLSKRTLLGELNGPGKWADVYRSTVRDRGFRRKLPNGRDWHPLYERWNQHLSKISGWLWDVLLGPVDDHLRNRAKLSSDAPVVLLPPGLLGVLPLHAAAPHTGGPNFGERWTVSYAPSVRTLLACREKVEASRRQPRKLLAIIDPPGQARLLGARQEAEVLRRYFSQSERVMLEDARATLLPVLLNLTNATYIHASTHGAHHPVLPQRSGLHLADEPLELGRLRDAQLAAARLVYLSACESGLASVWRMPDEFIGLPAGFVQAGAAGVIGSLWPVFDDTAFLISRQFYHLHLDENGTEVLPPAIALRQAQHWLRSVTFGDLREEFPVQQGTDGEYLLLRGESRAVGGQGAPALALRLGADHEQPYSRSHEHTAFTFTGA